MTVVWATVVLSVPPGSRSLVLSVGLMWIGVWGCVVRMIGWGSVRLAVCALWVLWMRWLFGGTACLSASLWLDTPAEVFATKAFWHAGLHGVVCYGGRTYPGRGCNYTSVMHCNTWSNFGFRYV